MGNRWGEEEKKNKGIFGCLVAFVFLGLCVYVFSVNYKQLEHRRQLAKQVEDIIRGGLYKSVDDMTLEIYKVYEDLGIPYTNDDVKMREYLDDNHNRCIDTTVKYVYHINVLGLEFDIQLDIKEDVPLIIW